ncbi:hypothetical protein CHLNCDRAFT_138354 [Chlorella variabilis]|uniref:Uncharacterized protein n=1 Tax=Chlorella variabilis TaxID=554065 RepID=E1ZMV2_CHLVA|nr:hypothetical protein CHLNCDRAFT_138354 [Chlorella variabilis]EFN52866.1 hypothetical protein CHLNCDRAFT_138354 [Chlorella variabilis]|eukprot:XP_005844968.1 hypothetical protein CHLNCDRAFT_138354 [Chlorella variabilis]
MEKTPLRLPKLKTRDELLRTAPELGRLLATGEGEAGGAGAAAAPAGRVPSPLKARPRSSPSRRAASPGRLVRKFTDDELTEEERVRAELEKVKAERATLLTSLARLRADTGKSGGELQQEDIRLLRRELEAKQDKLNELRRVTRELTDTMEQLETTSRDCDQLMPQGMAELVGHVEGLGGELAGVERDILEAEAKHELYKLLEVRTRRDHAAAQQRMRDARALKEGAADDYTALARQMHEMRAAKENAECDLGAAVLMYDQMRSDWSKKLKDRRKEAELLRAQVRELERRRAEDDKRKAALEALAAEKTRLEQEKVDKTRTDREAATRRLSAVVPELELLEASWARLHGVCGAATAEDLIAYWQELKAKEASMRELVRLAEVREARAKREMAALLAEKAEVFDTDTARGERRQAAAAAEEAGAGEGEAAPERLAWEQVAAEPAVAASAAATEAAAAEEGVQPGTGGAGAVEAPPESGADSPAAAPAGSAPPSEQAGDEEAAPASGTQAGPAQEEDTAEPAAGVAALEAPAEVAAQPAAEAPAEVSTPAEAEMAAAAATSSAAAAVDMEELLREKQVLIVEARRRKKVAKQNFSKLSQVCVAADQGLHLLALRLKGAMDSGEAATRRLSLRDGRRLTSMTDSRRCSVGGRRVTGANRRTTGQHAMRVSAAGLIERRASIQLLPAPAAAEGVTPRAPQGASIHDKDFFPELPSALAEVGGQLDRLMRLVQEMEAAAAAAQQAAATAAAAEAERMLTGRSMADSEMSGVGEDGAAAEPTPTLTPPATAGPGSGSRLPSKKQLQWADGQATPRVPGEGTGKEGGGEEDGDGGSDTDPEAAVAAAQGEKELRKGFRRRTWAGPAWLNAVSAGKPLTASLRKMTASRGGKAAGTPGAGRGRGAASLALKRIVGYVEEPGSGDDAGNPFVLSSSEDEVEEEGVVDRQYLKHRAHKLTNPKVRGKAGVGAAANSPAAPMDAR